MKYSLTPTILMILVMGTGIAGADEKATRVSFLEACASSAHVAETSDCNCVYNEVISEFGRDDLDTLLPFVKGQTDMDRSIQESFSFIVGKCEG